MEKQKADVDIGYLFAKMFSDRNAFPAGWTQEKWRLVRFSALKWQMVERVKVEEEINKHDL